MRTKKNKPLQDTRSTDDFWGPFDRLKSQGKENPETVAQEIIDRFDWGKIWYALTQELDLEGDWLRLYSAVDARYDFIADYIEKHPDCGDMAEGQKRLIEDEAITLLAFTFGRKFK